MYDIAIIGGGVIGGCILRELSKYKLNAVMLEKGKDVCSGASKANSGIVHAGFDALPGSKKAYFNVAGNKMMPAYCEELGVKYKNNGSLVIAFNEDEKAALTELLSRGEQNGVDGLEVISGDKVRELEPNLSKNVIAALHAKTGGIVCPYELTFKSIGSAMDNGAELKTEFLVASVNKIADGFEIISATGEKVAAKVVINCAGAHSGEIAKLFGDNSIKIGLRRGEYILLDRESGDFVSHTIFCTPTKKGKGILITNTVDGNILLGPTADELEKEDKSTTAVGLDTVKQKAALMADNVPFYNTITSFAGDRAYSADRHDFIIEESESVSGLINVCGIESPGLTSAPAIAKYVANELVGKKFKLVKKEDFNPHTQKVKPFKALSEQEKNQLIKQNPAYGNVICRCEKITEGEIISAIRTNPPAKTVDAVKRRTRAGMGRCQGGFCQPRVAEILSRELNVPLESVTKDDKGSEIVFYKTK